LGMETMVETNGSKPEAIKEMIGKNLVDYWATDFKVMLDDYRRLVGGKNTSVDLIQDVQESWKLMLNSGRYVEFRTTVVPGIHDGEKLAEMGRWLHDFVGESAGEKVTWVLQRFLPQNCLDPEYLKIVSHTEGQMEELWKKTRKTCSFVRLRDGA